MTEASLKPYELKARATFAKNLRRVRTERKIEVAELAARVGCSAKQLYHIERGRYWMSMPIYLRLCRVFGWKAPRMFGGVAT